MNGFELPERLIEDVKKSITAANVAKTVSISESDLTIDKEWIKISCDITIPIFYLTITVYKFLSTSFSF